jgi:hypothetical protein
MLIEGQIPTLIRPSTIRTLFIIHWYRSTSTPCNNISTRNIWSDNKRWEFSRPVDTARHRGGTLRQQMCVGPVSGS